VAEQIVLADVDTQEKSWIRMFGWCCFHGVNGCPQGLQNAPWLGSHSLIKTDSGMI
jgi:hypothetical protein